MKNTLKTKSDRKVPDVTTLIHINQYNTDKQNLEEKLMILIKKVSGLITTSALNTKISGLVMMV